MALSMNKRGPLWCTGQNEECPKTPCVRVTLQVDGELLWHTLCDECYHGLETSLRWDGMAAQLLYVSDLDGSILNKKDVP